MRPGFVVILEGVDKTGKTTVANDLRNILGWPIIKHSQPKPPVTAYEEYNATLDRVTEPFIADRFHLGEAVYGPLYRGTQTPANDVVIPFEMRLHVRGALLIFMTDKAEPIKARWREHKEDFAQEDMLRKMLLAYESEYEASLLPKLRLRLEPDLALKLVPIIRNMEAASR